MAAILPMAVYGLEVPAGDVAIAAKPDIPAAFRITMAAIDPSAVPELSEGADPAQPRATLKIIREPLMAGMDDYDDESDFDEDEMEALLAEDEDEDSEESEDEAVAGGPSDPAKSKKARKQAAADQLRKELAEQMEIDAPNGVNGKAGKGKGKLLAVAEEDGEDEEDDEDEDDDDESIDEPEEFVICTLDPNKLYQQTLDITIGEDERVWFKVSGTHSIFLTGNYVEPADSHSHPYGEEYDSEDDDDDDYGMDLEPDEDELDEDELSEDELDDMEDPRITELPDEEEVPVLIKAEKKDKKDKKGKNKRAAEDSADEGAAETLDSMIKDAAAATNGDAKLSKKQMKKLKKNDGQAVAVESKDEAPASTKSDKKVQFAKELEQGPTPTKADAKAKATTGPKTVGGVTIDDKKIGTGPAAKKGDRIGMRYIGKLQKDGKVFDSNKKGKPFSFKLGIGEVIKGWDIGIAGMSVGGERRITVPGSLAYGSKGVPGIPPNSTLIFDVKCIEIK